jgi:dihydroorotase
MSSPLLLKNFRIVDEQTDMAGSLLVEDGLISAIIPGDGGGETRRLERGAAMIIDGGSFPGFSGRDRRPLLMPAFIDLHAHFREPGFTEKETLESACLAAAAGGYGTLVCMANTRPVIDSLEKALALRERCDALGLIELYPVLSLTKNMEGRELSGITALKPGGTSCVRMLSEDGKDVADDGIFLGAMKEARRLGLPVSCHCDFGGTGAEAAKASGGPRKLWSRMEENTATGRALDLGRQAGCHIHIAHVSTKEAVEMVRRAKKETRAAPSSFTLTCEASPHHLACTEAEAHALGDESWGRVNPPLREEADRQALIEALRDGTIDAIATDHAPHSEADKKGGAPGFSGLETAFAVCLTELVAGGACHAAFDLRRLSSLMSANPARILGLDGKGRDRRARGRVAPGLPGDLVIADAETAWKPDPGLFKSRGKNTPFAGRELWGKVLMTIQGGRIVYVQHG